MLNYKLCLDSQGRYVYDCGDENSETYFYKYIKLDRVSYMSGSVEVFVNDAYKVISKVIWNNGGYYETQIDTIVTDWRKL